MTPPLYCWGVGMFWLSRNLRLLLSQKEAEARLESRRKWQLHKHSRYPRKQINRIRMMQSRCAGSDVKHGEEQRPVISAPYRSKQQ